MASIFAKAPRTEHYEDRNGLATFVRHKDIRDDYTLDFTELLAGETISSASWDVSGLTNNAESNTTTTVTLDATGTNGTAEVTVTTSGSRKIVRKFAVESPSWDGSVASDYP